MRFLNQDLPNRVRSNHALEHATLHVLQQKGSAARLGGISDTGGFWIFGDVDTETLLLAAREARERLMAGESHWRCIPIAAPTWRSARWRLAGWPGWGCGAPRVNPAGACFGCRWLC